ncbi:Alpha/Beta hydrolase protein [Podospora australis]|uniref:Alpha/Beta hydrolase protein n=1 Tax=Podospora australis TaxID=1536484 RepID=A0AAN7AG22_9PEZI|nr:Alpha/Beta hydrolase protein [Podospora australis]
MRLVSDSSEFSTSRRSFASARPAGHPFTNLFFFPPRGLLFLATPLRIGSFFRRCSCTTFDSHSRTLPAMGGSAYAEVECKTLDGVVLRGWLFTAPGDGPAPIIIMSHGFNCVKAMTLPDIAEWFQSKGYNVLLYDPRGVGTSDGLPRNQIDPLRMAEDLSDIITFAAARVPSADPKRILLWGMSFGGMVSGCTAAVDTRPRALVMVAPLFSFIRPERRRVTFKHVIKDRVSQLRGNEPLSLPPFDRHGENLAGFGGAGGPGGLEAFNLMRGAAERGDSEQTGFRDRITLQTYHKMALARPAELLEMVDERMSVMMVVPELDDISDPAEQKAAFAKLTTSTTSGHRTSPGVRKLHVAKEKGHLSIMTGEGSQELLEEMHQFYQESLVVS